MIDAIRIENLRSLKDTDFIKLKKLNILLGGNSSGKSTFLRSFPLFAQSVKKNLRGPISWFDDSMVDFGNYEIAINFNAGKKEQISFSYRLQPPYSYNFRFMDFHIIGSSLFERCIEKFKDEIECKVSFSNDKNGTYVNMVQLSIKDYLCSFFIEKRDAYVKAKLNGDLFDIPNANWIHNTAQGILPRFELIEAEDSFVTMTARDALLQNVYEKLRKFCRKNFSRLDRLQSIVLSWSLDKEKFLKMMQSKKSLKSLSMHAQKWTLENRDFLEIYNGILVYFFMNIINVLDFEMTSFYDKCGYVAPFRAEASRYYRSQGLQVNDIDPYGRNLQEFISSLTKAQLDDYNNFLENILKIRVFVKASAGHYSIILSDNGHQVNMTDVGFGYSQVLPILTKLWYAHSKKRLSRLRYNSFWMQSNVTLIEQPELHLHPAMQALVADALVDFLDFSEIFNRISMRDVLIVETHSQTIINRLGRRIHEGKLSPDDVNVLLFSKSGLNADTTIRVSKFNEKGQLTNWPYGFFDPDNN